MIVSDPELNVSFRELVAEDYRTRARMVKRRFDRDIDDPLLYDVVWNTDRVPMPVISRCVAVLVRSL